MIASGPNPDNETYTVSFKPGEGTWTALGVHIVQEDSLPGERLARGADRVIVTEVDAEIGRGRKLKFVLASQSNKSDVSPDVPAMAAIDGDPKTGWGISGPGDNNDIMLALRFAEKLHTQKDSVITVRLHQDSEIRRATIGRFRIALSRRRVFVAEFREATEEGRRFDEHRIAGCPSSRRWNKEAKRAARTIRKKPSQRQCSSG